MAANGLFTIEQIELIRRLKNSGLTKEQVCSAFDSFSRLNNELGSVYNSPISNPVRDPAAVSMDPSSSMTLRSSNRRTSASVGRSISHDDESHSSTSPSDEYGYGPSYPCSTSQSFHSPLMAPGYDIQDNSPEMLQLLNNGEDVINEEIRTFITKYNIRQHTIGHQCGLSQSYVSRYCRGDFYEMSDKSKKSIYRWYLAIKKKITDTDGHDPQPIIEYITTSASSFAPLQRRLSSSIQSPDYGDTIGRRERFTFRQAHLDILENHFQHESYPSYETRDELAHECNVTAPVPGRELTGQIVSNWFANKRKEVKKLTKTGKLLPANAPHLREKCGRPSHNERFAMGENSGDKLSQQVELAAVSQAILSLSSINEGENQSSAIKAEYHVVTGDDDDEDDEEEESADGHQM